MHVRMYCLCRHPACTIDNDIKKGQHHATQSATQLVRVATQSGIHLIPDSWGTAAVKVQAVSDSRGRAMHDPASAASSTIMAF